MHARNEGPGGCVPWEDFEAAEARVADLELALRNIAQVTKPEGWGSPSTVAIHGMAQHALKGEQA